MLALLGGWDDADNDVGKVGARGQDGNVEALSSVSVGSFYPGDCTCTDSNVDDSGTDSMGGSSASGNNNQLDPTSPFAFEPPHMGSAMVEPVQEVCDIDILLENSTCKRFVLRCVKNELPPNLIHCLRLLQVLELQHNAAYANQQRQLEEKDDENKEEDEGSVFEPGGDGGGGGGGGGGVGL